MQAIKAINKYQQAKGETWICASKVASADSRQLTGVNSRESKKSSFCLEEASVITPMPGYSVCFASAPASVLAELGFSQDWTDSVHMKVVGIAKVQLVVDSQCIYEQITKQSHEWSSQYSINDINILPEPPCSLKFTYGPDLLLV